MSNLRDELHLALVFFTRLPWPQLRGSIPPFKKTIWAWPLVGLIVGIIAFLGFIAGYYLTHSHALAAGCAIFLATIITGALHEDGFADCTDSIGGHNVDTRRKIMKDSAVGTFGALALIFIMGVRWISLSSMPVSFVSIASILIAIHVLSRVAILVPLVLFSPASAQGLGSQLSGFSYQHIAISSLLALALTWLAMPIIATLIAFVIALCASALFSYFMVSRINGYNGDVLGGSKIAAELTLWMVLPMWV